MSEQQNIIAVNCGILEVQSSVMETLMYPEKPKREEKPKHSSKRKYALVRFILALLFLVPSLLFMLSRFNHEQFVDMALLTIMITLAVYLVYEIVSIFFSSVFRMTTESSETPDLPHESVNH